MNRIGRTVAAVLLATAVVTAASVTAAGAGSDRPTPKQWAKGVCTNLETWITSIEDTISSLEDASSLDDAVSTASEGIEKATRQLVNDLDDLGLPQTKNAKQAREAIEKLDRQLEHDVEDVEHILSEQSSDPVDIAAAFADIGTVVQKAIDQVQVAGDTLRGLDPNGSLQKALKSSPACKSLKNAV
jgi:polyhydroxyalkanoate synthesis regulator phasin